MANMPRVAKLFVTGFFGLGLGMLTPLGIASPPDSVIAANPSLTKVGEGQLNWFLFKVYRAQLWADASVKPYDYKTTDTWLRLEYLRDLNGKDIAQRSVEEMRGQGYSDESKLARWGKTLEDIFPDIKEGDSLGAYFSAKSKQIDFFFNGKPRGQISEPEFAVAFMGIWLDKKTSEPEFRKTLLGQ